MRKNHYKPIRPWRAWVCWVWNSPKMNLLRWTRKSFSSCPWFPSLVRSNPPSLVAQRGSPKSPSDLRRESSWGNWVRSLSTFWRGTSSFRCASLDLSILNLSLGCSHFIVGILCWARPGRCLHNPSWAWWKISERASGSGRRCGSWSIIRFFSNPCHKAVDLNKTNNTENELVMLLLCPTAVGFPRRIGLWIHWNLVSNLN